MVSGAVEAEVLHNHRILDLGCANGGLLAASKNKGFKDLTGVDPSEAASLYCRPDIITLSQGSTSCYGIC